MLIYTLCFCRWRDYKPCGVPIRGERIIPFKTPLSNVRIVFAACDAIGIIQCPLSPSPSPIPVFPHEAISAIWSMG